jgi:hypothetical protein
VEVPMPEGLTKVVLLGWLGFFFGAAVMGYLAG